MHQVRWRASASRPSRRRYGVTRAPCIAWLKDRFGVSWQVDTRQWVQLPG
ncbi:hypothetical protein EER27_05605 [Lysobacter psychrotolerans]|uniref:Uncharacterized protein n=1 Tax=Montanilutibacter psychrotolerans TaxID=1327343 RepID=A0A3M8T139_9GAMM|nr:hypothetical protein EER27_05605 [Lysobacter psychrotolerans]